MREEKLGSQRINAESEQGGKDRIELIDPKLSRPSTTPENDIDSESTGNQSQDKKEAPLNKVEKYTLTIAWVGLILASVTGVVFFRQLEEMRLQTKILSKQVEDAGADAITARRQGREQIREMQAQVDAVQLQTRQDQRPYIWTYQDDTPKVKIGETVAWNFHYTNFGKSPAVGVAVRCQVRLEAQKTPQSKDMFAPLHKPGYEYAGYVVPQNDKTTFSTCFSNEIVTEADIKLMSAYDAGAKLMLYFEYSDVGGNIYTSQICRITRRPGQGSAVAVCPEENRIK